MEPTSGEAKICGLDIVKDTASVHRIIGLCPQHNIMFEHLTVYQHIEFMMMVGGMMVIVVIVVDVMVMMLAVMVVMVVVVVVVVVSMLIQPNPPHSISAQYN